MAEVAMDVEEQSDPSKQWSKEKRMQGISLSRPFVYGSTAQWLGKKAEEGHSHRWTIHVRGLHGEDLSYLIKRVVFTLHHSCQEPVVVRDAPPFEVTQTGWGEFECKIKLYLRDEIAAAVSLTAATAVRGEGGASYKSDQQQVNPVGSAPPEEVDPAGHCSIDLFHLLQLYPQGSNTTQSMKKPVVSEVYDEMVFFEPTEYLYHTLLDGATQSLKQTRPSAEHTHFSEFADMEKILSAQHFVNQELESTKQQIIDIEKQILEARKRNLMESVQEQKETVQQKPEDAAESQVVAESHEENKSSANGT